MNKHNIKYVKWVIDFIQTDISELSFGEWAKLEAEITVYTVSIISGGQKNNYSGPPRIGIDNMVETQRKATEKYKEEGYSELWKLRTGLLTDDNLEEIRKELKDFFDLIIINRKFSVRSRKTKRGTTQFWPDPSPPIRVNVNSSFTLLLQNNYKSTKQPDFVFSIHDEIQNGDATESLKFKFLVSLEGISFNAFNKCRECNKWFLHVTKKIKIYCSNKCASRHIVRKKRENLKNVDKKEYNKKGAERARKSYEKKQKEKFPNIKISRYPSKHKEE